MFVEYKCTVTELWIGTVLLAVDICLLAHFILFMFDAVLLSFLSSSWSPTRVTQAFFLTLKCCLLLLAHFSLLWVVHLCQQGFHFFSVDWCPPCHHHFLFLVGLQANSPLALFLWCLSFSHDSHYSVAPSLFLSDCHQCEFSMLWRSIPNTSLLLSVRYVAKRWINFCYYQATGITQVGQPQIRYVSWRYLVALWFKFSRNYFR